jgi:hypothetical protein
MANPMTRKNAIWVIAAIAVLGCLLIYLYLLKGKSPVQTSGASSPSGPFLAWKFANERTTFSSVTLGSDGTIYGSSSQGVFAISPDGKLKWHAQYGGLSYAAMGSNGILYVAEMHGLAFGVSPDGTVSWKPQVGLIGFHAPPAIGGSTVLYANTTSDLFAFEQDSTAVAWSQNTFRPGVISENSSLPGSAQVGMTSLAAPAIYSDDSIALPRQHWLNLFGRDGSPVWSLELTPGQLGTAALGEDGTIYVTDGTTLYAVDRSGSLSWKYAAAGGCIGSPVIDADGTIYFSSARSMSALARDGSLKWNVKTSHGFETSPVLVSDGSIYVGASDALVALNPDGTEKWSVHTPFVNAAPAIAADGTAYFVCGYIWVCAVEDIHSPLMKSPWPRIYHDSANSGNILTPF